MFYALLMLVFLYLFYCVPRVDRTVFTTGGYLSQERTTLLNGFFILLVYIRHATSYTDAAAWTDWNRHFVENIMLPLDQMLVSGFFLYSGYGIMTSLQRKGGDYMKGFLRCRFLKVLVMFDIAVLLFGWMKYALGTGYPVERWLLALTGWTSLGNSNWFIFDTLCLYLLFWFAWFPFRRNRWLHLGAFSLLVVGLYYTLKGVKGWNHWWYDTLACMPAGCLLALTKDKLQKGISLSRIPAPVIGALLILFAYKAGRWFHLPLDWELFNLRSVCFALGLLLALSWIRFERKPALLLAAGASLFSLYIFQRMPMLWFSARMPELKGRDDMFYLLTFLAMLLIACVAKPLFGVLSKYCFSRRSR